MKIKNKGFTLVELIVVITILAVLATIGFLSFQGYSAISRDSVRLSDIKNIQKGFNLKITKGEKLPVPDNKIDINASGSLINYQGFAGTGTLGFIGVHGDAKDPLDNSFYTYSTNLNRDKYQLLTFFEKQDITFNIENTFANLNERFPKVVGDNLGIILNSTSKQPSQIEDSNIDIINTNNNYNFIINNSSEGSFTGNGGNIIYKWSESIQAHSCEEILSYFSNEYLEDNNYPIISNTGERIEVFCDMKNGGYTGLFSVDPSGVTWKYDSTEWINPTVKENNFLTEETTLKSYSDFNTNDIKICRGDLVKCYNMQHNKNIPLHVFYTDDISYIKYSEFKYLDNYPPEHNYNNNISGPENIGTDIISEYLTQLGLTSSLLYLKTPRYSKFGLGINLYSRNKLGLQADNNNSWPSFDNFSIGIGGFAPYSNGTSNCLSGYPHSYSEATSIHISGQECYIENPDTVMWYILGK